MSSNENKTENKRKGTENNWNEKIQMNNELHPEMACPCGMASGERRSFAKKYIHLLTEQNTKAGGADRSSIIVERRAYH